MHKPVGLWPCHLQGGNQVTNSRFCQTKQTKSERPADFVSSFFCPFDLRPTVRFRKVFLLPTFFRFFSKIFHSSSPVSCQETISRLLFFRRIFFVKFQLVAVVLAVLEDGGDPPRRGLSGLRGKRSYSLSLPWSQRQPILGIRFWGMFTFVVQTEINQKS